MYIDIKLDKSQNGYDEVSMYIERFFKNNVYDDVVIRLGTSYDGKEYDVRNEVASPYMGTVEFLYDWWEGEQFIRIYGIRTVCDIEFNGEGIYEE